MEEQPIQRPTFLSVLCILTFVWAGFSILMSLVQIPNLYVPTADNPQLQASMEQIRELNPAVAEGMNTAFAEIDKHKIPNWIVAFIGNCFSLMGALMMWKLQKRGLYIYAAAEILPLIFSIFFSGLSSLSDALGMLGPMVNVIVTIAIAFVFIFDVLFIALYAMNHKHME